MTPCQREIMRRAIVDAASEALILRFGAKHVDGEVLRHVGDLADLLAERWGKEQGYGVCISCDALTIDCHPFTPDVFYCRECQSKNAALHQLTRAIVPVGKET